MKLYLSGKITDCKNYKVIFSVARKKLEDAGYTVIDPTTLKIPEDTPWHSVMKKTIPKLVSCDGIALIFNWQESRGAVLEAGLALDIYMQAHTVDIWIQRGAKKRYE